MDVGIISLVCVGFVVIFGTVLYMFGFKEETYDKAREEQRKRHNIDVVSPKFLPKTEKKKDRKEKKQKPSKKSREKETLDLANEVVANQVDSSVLSTTPGEESSHHKNEHVEFKEAEVVIVDDEFDESRIRKVVVDDKPRKSILINKPETLHLLSDLKNDSGDGHGRTKRVNSFNIVHPKDDFELIKLRESKKNSAKVGKEGKVNEISPLLIEQTYDRPSVKVEAVEKLNGSEDEEKKEEIHIDSQVQASLESFEEVKDSTASTASPARKTKKQKSSNSTAVALASEKNSDLSTKKLIELVNTAQLNNEDIQTLINVLLNKQGDGSTEWTKKNDPVVMLKKQLQEKEQAYDAEVHNLNAAKERMKELRQELAQEKMKQTVAREKITQQLQENQSMQSRFQQVLEQQKCEIKSLQTKMSKISDERSVALQRMQEENTRLQQALQQLEADRAGLETLPRLKHENEQLRADRQQFDRRQSAMQQANEDLHRQVQQLEDHLKSVAGAKQKDEFSYQQQLTEVSKKLQQTEAAKTALVEDFKQACQRCNSLENENQALINRVKQSEDKESEELKQIHVQITELSNENARMKVILEEKERLLDSEQKRQNGETCNKEAELQSLNESLSQLKNELEIQRKKNDELREKNRITVEALNIAESETANQIKLVVKEQESLQKSNNDLSVVESEKKLIENRLEKLEQERDNLIKERQHLAVCMSKITPTQEDMLLTNLELVLKELLDSRKNATSNVSQEELTNLRKLLAEEQESSTVLKTQLASYKTTLSETESTLNILQVKVEEEEKNWNLQLLEKQDAIKNLLEDKDKLLQEKTELEASIIQGLRETITEMEQKLKELQMKLRGEENEKKILEAKFDEINKTIEILKSTSEEQNKQIQTLSSEKEELEKIKSESDQLRTDLDKEKKTAKDLQANNTRLKSLVKIGEDSLKAEQLRVNELEQKLSLRNGSVSSSCVTSNGSPESLKVTNTIVPASDSSTEEGASLK